jgi:CheY-like chemotaxis protein
MQPDHRHAAAAIACRPKALMCGDHREDNRDLLIFLLFQVGYEVVIATTGADCLQQAQRGDYTLVLLDVRLPDGSGIELCKQIRHTHPQTTVVFYTADARHETYVQALAAGASGYLPMPIDPMEFVNLAYLYKAALVTDDGETTPDSATEINRLFAMSDDLKLRSQSLERTFQQLSKHLQYLYADSDKIISRHKNSWNDSTE